MHAPAAETDSLVIACPHCHTLGRVPAKRLGDEPKCARCKSPLLHEHPIPLDAESFENHVGRASFPVLVDFWAPWCGPCVAMAPVLDRAAAEWRTRLQVGKVNTDEQQQLAGRFGIRSIPTLILFRDGGEVARRAGASDLGSLTRWISESLAG